MIRFLCIEHSLQTHCIYNSLESQRLVFESESRYEMRSSRKCTWIICDLNYIINSFICRPILVVFAFLGSVGSAFVLLVYSICTNWSLVLHSNFCWNDILLCCFRKIRGRKGTGSSKGGRDLLPWIISNKKNIIFIIHIYKFPSWASRVIKLPFQSKHACNCKFQLIIAFKPCDINGPADRS